MVTGAPGGVLIATPARDGGVRRGLVELLLEHQQEADVAEVAVVDPYAVRGGSRDVLRGVVREIRVEVDELLARHRRGAERTIDLLSPPPGGQPGYQPGPPDVRESGQ